MRTNDVREKYFPGEEIIYFGCDGNDKFHLCAFDSNPLLCMVKKNWSSLTKFKSLYLFWRRTEG